MEKNIFTDFGNFLQETRIQKGLSQEELAELANLDRTYISLLERGKRNPSFSCIYNLCKVLEIDIIK